jgi:redox-sensitive bicupin YhaK (pirin superfamily)
MITLRRAKDRHRDQRRKREVWLTFEPQDRADPLADGFGTLEIFSEDRLGPGASALGRPRHDAEIITYVREGALAYEDSTGQSGVIHAGEFQRMTASRRVRHSETNASRTDSAHVFQIWLRPSQAEREPSREQKRFSLAERRGTLCVVASPDARRGSLLIHQDAMIYSALLEPGQHVIHELSRERLAWLHLVDGEVTLEDLVLSTGDSVGVTSERAVSLTAREESEILLFDLGERRPADGLGVHRAAQHPRRRRRDERDARGDRLT